MSTIAKPMNVFVYGTLKTHQPNHYWLQKNKGHATFICNGVTVDTFPLLVATKFNIPFMLNRPGVGKNVHGEIYEIDETMLTNLDDLEDYPQLYNRIIANVIGSDRVHRGCYIYVLDEFPPEYLTEYTFLEEYKNTIERPYAETYLDSCTPEDLYSSA